MVNLLQDSNCQFQELRQCPSNDPDIIELSDKTLCRMLCPSSQAVTDTEHFDCYEDARQS